ncbi:ComF family protein [Thiohalophilus thiocyanatoxydans]|uniref:ComF family protein n=1 Tax=Thiohalophilus thiocyanatoxydans TaxID=381308 RepID=A0A4R8ITW2_9GAMM|nr:ComF family protein [Thiohalophilus thiocyanatoxydans]TDY04078.1 ComF family protein [Thiohalophilus thiocyanatoxydans]
MNNWLNFDLFRPGCWLCHTPLTGDSPLCPACFTLLPRNQHACRRCALPTAPGQILCGHCLSHPPVYQHSLIPFIYAPPLDQLITRLKFQQRLPYARLLGVLLGQSLPAARLQSLDALLPVPLHPRRLRERGYNQSLEIGRFIARQCGLPLLTRHTHRRRHTEAQSRLALEQRRRNLRQAFYTDADLRGRAIGIIDDVVTSGHTVNELARCLRRAGAESITVIAVARADSPR